MAYARSRRENSKEFLAKDWINNHIQVIRQGTPGPGQIGPHGLPPTGKYDIKVNHHLSSSKDKPVGLTIVQERTTGIIHLYKAPKVPAFNGTVFLKVYL